MADKDKNSDDFADFSFDTDGWEDDAKDSSFPGAPASEKDDDPFGAGAFGEDDDAFGPLPEDEDGDAFAAAVDSFANEDEDPFQIQEMPMPGANPDRAALGNPDDEFDDLSGDSFGGDFASSDGFDDGDSLFEDEENKAAPSYAESFDEEDPFAEDDQSQPMSAQVADDEEDPFGSEPEEEAEPEEAAAEEKPARQKSRLILPVALAASVAFVGMVGYSVILPMFSSPVAPPVQVTDVQPMEPAFPSALPGQPGGLDIQPVEVEEPQMPSLPTVSEPSIPALPDFEEVDVADAPVLPATQAPAFASDTPVVSLPQDKPASTLPALDDFVGGSDRGGIDAMREAERRPAADGDAAITAIETRLAALEAKVDGLADNVAAVLARPAAQIPATPSLPDLSQERPAAVANANLAEVVPPLKPVIVETATLKGVSRGLAWVSTPSGVVEVKAGDTIPGAGKVVKIREYQGKWIVVTTDGLVVQ